MTVARFEDGVGLVIDELRHILQVLDPEEALGNYTLAELRAYCKRFGLKSVGCKRDIIYALAEHVEKSSPEGEDDLAAQSSERSRSGLKIQGNGGVTVIPLSPDRDLDIASDHTALHVDEAPRINESKKIASANFPALIQQTQSPEAASAKGAHANVEQERTNNGEARCCLEGAASTQGQARVEGQSALKQDIDVAIPNSTCSTYHTSAKAGLATSVLSCASPLRISQGRNVSTSTLAELVGTSIEQVPTSPIENRGVGSLKRKSSSLKLPKERYVKGKPGPKHQKTDSMVDNKPVRVSDDTRKSDLRRNHALVVEIRLAFSGLPVAKLNVFAEDDVSTLKSKVSALRSWPPGAQQLLLGGKVLDDSVTLVDSGVQNGSIICVLCESLRWHNQIKGQNAEIHEDRLTVSRRDSCRKFSGALVIANGSARSFSFTVIDNSARFAGGVEVGFTCMPPHALADDFPQSAVCLRNSFICDCHGEFHAYKGSFHALDIDFEEQGWDPEGLRRDDVVTCRATESGRMQIEVNGHAVADWDAGIPRDEHLYPVVSLFGKMAAIRLTPRDSE